MKKKLFHLIDMESGNVAGSYQSLEAVLDDLCGVVQEHGIAAAEGYGLLQIEGEEQSAYAQPEELVELVLEHIHSVAR